MNYRTTCPQCASVFRLGADQLDVAQGWVQCSVCGAAFDAHPSLLMEDGSPLSIEATPEPAETPALPEAAQAPAQAADKATPEAAPAEDVVVADAPRGIIQREVSLDLPSIILIDPDIPVPDDPGPLPQFYPAPAYPHAPDAPVYPFTPIAPAAPARPAARIEYATPLPATARTPSARRHIQPWAWGVASALLLVLLLAQTAYFLRDALVSRLPQTRPAFEQICAVTGCTLSLPKNLALLQIVGSDLQTEASGRLNLVLTLGNRANHAQAWPVLILTLTDQRNRPLARRSFAPSEYLGDTQRIATGIPPRSEQALSLPLTVRDLTPMGFDLQLTY
ncbi:MAG: zinc-ribbon domain-containing protein [Gammaproteobacteria bacterium]|nr:zinc-ribbon domain-containing protein [Gammaproteobacteria bacterium]